MAESSTARPRHEVLAVVLQVREGELRVLLWQRAREPFLGAWALPGGRLEPHETLEASIRRHLAAKVDVRARTAFVHDLGAAGPLPGGARPRRLGDEPAAHTPPPPPARADGRASPPR